MALECDADDPLAYGLLAKLLNEQRDYDESEKLLQEGVRHSPGAWQFYFQLGIAHFGLGDYPKAQGEYSKVLSLNPTPSPDFYVKCADLYLKVGSYDKAYGEMEAYLRADPNGRFAAKIKDIMRQMEATGAVHPSQAKAATPASAKP